MVSKDGSLKKEEMKKKGRSLEREVEETRAGLKSEEEEKRREERERTSRKIKPTIRQECFWSLKMRA